MAISLYTAHGIRNVIVNPYIINNENAAEFNAIKSVKYRLTEQVKLEHHDFTIYGRIITGLLHLREEDAGLADNIYKELHEHVLYFLKNQNISADKTRNASYFKLEKF
ncbi:MAG: hypothetical protein QM737_16865 [Ferruginibacter sp.]